MGLYIKKGEPLCVSSGVYESYIREGPYVALRDFAFTDAIEEFKRKTPSLKIHTFCCTIFTSISWRSGISKRRHVDPFISGNSVGLI